MPGSPLVSVVLATHNDGRHLRGAVESILAQTLGDCELIVIDDGSADGSATYLGSITDPRVRVLTNAKNRGLPASLNRGLDVARGTFVARMDGDDLSEATRLAKQVEFLMANPEIGIVGTSRRLIDEQGETIAIAKAVEDDASIRWKCLLGNPFAHPTVMIRRSILELHQLRYDTAFSSAQDYELWTRLLPHTRAANLAEPLLCYRHRTSSISRSRRDEQLANHDRIILAANRRLLPGFPLNAAQTRELRGRYGGFSVRDPAMNPDDPEWLDLLRAMLSAFTAVTGAEPTVPSLNYGDCASRITAA